MHTRMVLRCWRTFCWDQSVNPRPTCLSTIGKRIFSLAGIMPLVRRLLLRLRRCKSGSRIRT